MKKLVLTLFVMMISATMFAQFIKTMPKGQVYRKNTNSNGYVNSSNKFATREEALNAYNAGLAMYYYPSDLKAYNNNPVDGQTRIAMALEHDARVLMPVVGGIKHVILKAGSICRWYVDPNGNIASAPYAFDACGNAIIEFEYITKCEKVSTNSYESVMFQGDGDVVNYSEKSYTQPYRSPNQFQYYGNTTSNKGYQYSNNKKGWSTTKKVIVVVAAAAVTYAIVHYSTQGKDSKNDQVVITGNAASAPKKPSFGLSFGVRF